MSIFDPASPPWPGRVLSIFRIVAAVVFITSGTVKAFNYPPAPMAMPPIEPFSQMWIGAWMEIIGGALILIGLFTRPVAFLLAGEMAVAYFQFHHVNSIWPTTNQGTPAILFCFLFLYLVFAGAGSWSVDAMLARKRT